MRMQSPFTHMLVFLWTKRRHFEKHWYSSSWWSPVNPIVWERYMKVNDDQSFQSEYLEIETILASRHSHLPYLDVDCCSFHMVKRFNLGHSNINECHIRRRGVYTFCACACVCVYIHLPESHLCIYEKWSEMKYRSFSTHFINEATSSEHFLHS